MVFVNLDDLIVRINERTVAELAKSFDAVNRKTDESHERLRLLTAAYLGFALLHTHRWRLVFEHRLPEGQHAPATYRTHTAAIFRLVSENLRGCRPRRDKARIDELAMRSGLAFTGSACSPSPGSFRSAGRLPCSASSTC